MNLTITRRGLTQARQSASPGATVAPTAPTQIAAAPPATSFAHAVPPLLPQGLPVRSEELAWVESAVARLENILDEGNEFVLDGEIAWRRRQWDAAVEAAAHQWSRAGRDFVAATSAQQGTQLSEVAGLRRRLQRLGEEDIHWRGILAGEPVRPLPRPAPFDPDLVGFPETHGMTVVDLDAVMPGQGTDPAPAPAPVPAPEGEGAAA